MSLIDLNSCAARLITTLAAAVLLSALAPLPVSAQSNDESFPTLSPFEAVRFADPKIMVQLDGNWYELFAINGVGAIEIMEFCEATYGELARKRFTEDLVQVLTQMGHPPEERVELTVRDLVALRPIVKPDVLMTRENRQRIARANRDGAKAPQLREQTVTRKQALEDLAMLEQAIEQRYSYRTLRDVDAGKAIEQLRANLDDEVNVAALAIEIQKVLARFGDGHTRVIGLHALLPEGYLPFAVAWGDSRVVAWDPSAEAFLREDAPYVVSMDGVEIDRWLDAAGRIVADGSPSLQTAGRLDALVYLNWLRGELGLPIRDDVTIELGGRMHMGLERVTLPVSADPVTPRESPRTSFELIDERFLWLRMPSFSTDRDPQHVERAVRGLNRARNTMGLIIDVRGNGGGGRRVLRYLLPYVMNPDEPPIVVNVARHRVHEEFGPSHLASRFLHRPEAEHWTEDERQAIEAFAESFEPQWSPPAEQFSDWHYMVVRRSAHDEVYHYAQPVVILMDRSCFSATDVFLAAFKGRPGVTLMGTPSGGGSGKAEGVRLPNTRLRVQLSSMVSYQPDGRLFEGHGVEPDIVVEPTATDAARLSDSQLDAAVRYLYDQLERE